MKNLILKKWLAEDEVIVHKMNFSIFNSIPSFLICLALIFGAYTMMHHTPAFISSKERLVNAYDIAINVAKYISIVGIVCFVYSVIRNLMGFAVITNKRIITFKGIFYSSVSEMEIASYGGNDCHRSLLALIFFYAKFSLYGYGLQTIEIPAIHNYKATREQLHRLKSI